MIQTSVEVATRKPNPTQIKLSVRGSERVPPIPTLGVVAVVTEMVAVAEVVEVEAEVEVEVGGLGVGVSG